MHVWHNFGDFVDFQYLDVASILEDLPCACFIEKWPDLLRRDNVSLVALMLADTNLVEWISGAEVLPASIYSTNNVLSDITVAESTLDAQHHTSISLIVVEVVSKEDSGLDSELRSAWLVGTGFSFSPDRNNSVSCEFGDISSKVDNDFDLFARVGNTIEATACEQYLDQFEVLSQSRFRSPPTRD